MQFHSLYIFYSLSLLSLVEYLYASVLNDFVDRDTLQTCLVNLRLSELLRLKKSLESIPNSLDSTDSTSAALSNSTEIKDKEDCSGPKAMALVGEDRVGYPDEHHPWKPEKPSKLQTLFQISITALAFMSFGGYLLCLIVQGIKSKGTTYFHPVASTQTTTVNRGVKRIKIYRRSRRYLEDDIILPRIISLDTTFD